MWADAERTSFNEPLIFSPSAKTMAPPAKSCALFSLSVVSLGAALAAAPHLSHVALCHCETTTGEPTPEPGL